jgi:histidyl-tRNA synthetase
MMGFAAALPILHALLFRRDDVLPPAGIEPWKLAMADPKNEPKNEPKNDPKADLKSNRPKARLPRGLADRGPAEIAATRAMIETIRKVYELYGFEPVETPAFEYTDALGKFLPDQDRPNEGVFSFQDDDEQWLSLRYDLTAPLARYVAENFDQLPKPYRSYRAGYVYRNEKPGPGRFRQFMQFDADTVGSASPAADAEICMMAADTMEALGLKGHYVVKVNNRKILDGLIEKTGIDPADAGRRMTILRALDKLDRLGWDEVKKLLGPGRKDESGDFTRGAGLADDAIYTLQACVEGGLPKDSPFVANPSRPMSDMKSNYPDTFVDNLYGLSQWHGLIGDTKSGAEGLRELTTIVELCEAAGYGSLRISVDPSVVRGLEYYTGPVYEVELTFPVSGEDGKPVRFGSVAGGGRYDGLVARFRGGAVPATGFSIGVSRLLAALTHLGKVEIRPEPGPVIVTVMEPGDIEYYQRLVTRLRSAEYAPGKKIRAELYLGSGKFGAQIKYADRRRSPCVVIRGSDEKAKDQVQIKDLILGAELAGLSKERDDYRQKQAAAQFAVPEADLVAKVREVLAKHGVKWGGDIGAEDSAQVRLRAGAVYIAAAAFIGFCIAVAGACLALSGNPYVAFAVVAIAAAIVIASLLVTWRITDKPPHQVLDGNLRLKLYEWLWEKARST